MKEEWNYCNSRKKRGNKKRRIKQENIELEKGLYIQSQLSKKNIPNQIALNTNEKYITETEIDTTNHNIINKLKNTPNNLPEILNPKDYYDNTNFVPMGKINPF